MFTRDQKINLFFTSKLALLLLVFVSTARAQSQPINLLENQNPGFESKKARWTNSGGAFIVVSSGSSLLFNKGSATWTPSAGSQTLRSALGTVPYGMQNAPCAGSFAYKGGDGNHVAKILDASDSVVASITLSASSDRKILTLPFACGLQGSQYRFSFESTAAAALMAIDRVHIGELAFSSFVDGIPQSIVKYTSGSGTYTPSVGTRYIRVRMVGGGGGGSGSGTGTSGGTAGTGGATTFGSSLLTANGGVGGVANSVGTIGGTASIGAGAMGTSLSGGNGGGSSDVSQAGYYIAGGNGGNSVFGGGGGGAGIGAAPVAATAGVANTGGGGGGGAGNSAVNMRAGSGGGAGGYVEAYISSPASSYAYAVGTGGAGGVAGTTGQAGGAGGSGYIEILEYAIAGGQAITPQTSGYRVDASLGASSDPSLGTSVVSTLTEITNASMDLIVNLGSAAVGIACANGNASIVGALTCSSNESAGITFNAPYGGVFRVCSEFSAGATITSGGSATLGFALAETAANSSAIIQNGNTKNNTHIGGSTTLAVESQLRKCGDFTFAAGGQKTIRLFYTLGGSAINGSNLMIGRAATVAGRDMHWTVEAITQYVPMAVFVGPNETTRTVSGATTLAPSDTFVLADSTGGAFTLTLPSAASAAAGKKISITKTNAAELGIAVSGNIEGVAKTVTIFDLSENVSFVSDGSTWQWISSPWKTVDFSFGGASEMSGCTSSPCTIYRKVGALVSVTRTGAGQFTANFPAGMFSTAPICKGNELAIANAGWLGRGAAPTLTAAYFNTLAFNAVLGDYGADVSCTGKR